MNLTSGWAIFGFIIMWLVAAAALWGGIIYGAVKIAKWAWGA